jgi:hypothetical protein
MLLTAGSRSAAQTEDKNPPPKYVGAKACASCHKSAATGNQYKVWQVSAHAKAYEVLASDKAADIAAAQHLSTEPQKTPACLSCHTTGAGAPKSRFTEDFDATQGVQCEACHGAGEAYGKIEHMIMHSQARERGLIEPTAAVCVKCHNAKSPTFKGFDYAAAVKQVRHKLAPK